MVTEDQLNILRHALSPMCGGRVFAIPVDPFADSYRDCRLLANAGLLERKIGGVLTAGYDSFSVTGAGKILIAQGEGRTG